MTSHRFFVIVFLLCTNTAFSFTPAGHMIIAAIAYAKLEPAVKQQMDELASSLALFYHNSSSFITCAPWADDIKKDIPQLTDTWHYCSVPINVGGQLTEQELHMITIELQKNNSIFALGQWRQTLQSTSACQLSKAIALRYVIHLAGDLHQPLHCAQLFNKKFPHGDESGEKFLLKNCVVNGRSFDNLLWLWNEGVGAFPKISPERTHDDVKTIQAYAQNLIERYPLENFGKKAQLLKIQDWAKESYECAKTVAYRVLPDAKPSTTYIRRGQNLMEQRVTLAGYRLAHLLNKSGVFASSYKK